MAGVTLLIGGSRLNGLFLLLIEIVEPLFDTVKSLELCLPPPLHMPPVPGDMAFDTHF